jgi:hypothetical protein
MLSNELVIKENLLFGQKPELAAEKILLLPIAHFTKSKLKKNYML